MFYRHVIIKCKPFVRVNQGIVGYVWIIYRMMEQCCRCEHSTCNIKTQINWLNEKHSLNMWGFRILIQLISCCSRFFLAFCVALVQRKTADCHGLARLSWSKVKIKSLVAFFFYHETQVTNLATFTSILVNKFVFYMYLP